MSYYKSGLVRTMSGAEDLKEYPHFYGWFLNNLRRESGFLDADSAVDVYKKLRSQFRNPTIADQLVMISMFTNASINGEAFGFPEIIYKTGWWNWMLVRASLLRTQVIQSRQGVEVHPEWEENWLAMGKFATMMDYIGANYDQLQGKDAVEVVRQTVRDLARSTVRSPLRDEILREVAREAKPWMPEIKTLAIIGGAVLGAAVLIPNMMSRAGRSVVGTASNYIPDSKGKRAAEAVAGKILQKTKG